MKSTLKRRCTAGAVLCIGATIGLVPLRADLVAPRGVSPRSITPAARIPVVVVRPLRAGGGLVDTGAPEQSGDALNVRLGRSLQKFLEEGARGRYSVAWAENNTTSSVGPRWVLEGELSHVATNAGGEEESGPYLGSLRLFRESDVSGQSGTAVERRLIGAWLGRSESLRLLSVNLRHDPRVHAQGLVGEWGRRVIETIVAYEDNGFATKFSRWLMTLPRSENSIGLLTRSEETKDGSASPSNSPSIAAGTDFALRITARERSEIYLLELDGDTPQVVPYEREGDIVRAYGVQKADGAVNIPSRRMMAAVNAGERRFVVLWRRINSGSSNALTLKSQAPVGNDSLASRPLRDAPVEVLGDAMQSRGELAATRRLYEVAAAEAPGVWSAREFNVRILARGE